MVDVPVDTVGLAVAVESPSVRSSTADTLLALLTATRPRQWLKNVLVCAAPLAAGQWAHVSVAAGAAVAFVAMTVTAAGSYLLNDVHDRDRDRLHPTKSRRPVAAGRISPSTAATAGALLVIGGAVMAWTFNRVWLVVVVVAYAALTAVYNARLKRVPLVEIAAVATGFVLRPLAGAAATGVPPSGWFLSVCCAGAFMVTIGKRAAELGLDRATGHRPALAAYSASGLRLARQLSALVMLGCYWGWVATRSYADRWPAAVSAIAVAVAVVRYGRMADRDCAGEPERLLLRDRVLQACALLWLVAFVSGHA